MSIVVFIDKLTQPSTAKNPPDIAPINITVTNDGSSWTGTPQKSERKISASPFSKPIQISIGNNFLQIISLVPATEGASIEYLFTSNKGNPLPIPKDSTFQAESDVVFFRTFLTDRITLKIIDDISGVEVFSGSASIGDNFTYSITITQDIRARSMSISFDFGFSLDRIQFFSKLQIVRPGSPFIGGGTGIKRLLCDPIDDCVCHKHRTKKCTKCRRTHICKFCGCDPRDKYDENNDCVNRNVVATVNTNNGIGNCRTCGQR